MGLQQVGWVGDNVPLLADVRVDVVEGRVHGYGLYTGDEGECVPALCAPEYGHQCCQGVYMERPNLVMLLRIFGSLDYGLTTDLCVCVVTLSCCE